MHYVSTFDRLLLRLVGTPYASEGCRARSQFRPNHALMTTVSDFFWVPVWRRDEQLDIWTVHTIETYVWDARKVLPAACSFV